MIASQRYVGIGYAISADGRTWVRSEDNPILHINDAGSAYRADRTYTPAVVDDGSGVLKMYYSAAAASGPKRIGLAILHRP